MDDITKTKVAIEPTVETNPKTCDMGPWKGRIQMVEEVIQWLMIGLGCFNRDAIEDCI